MQFHIRHRTVYEYSAAVHLDPHELRFLPRSGGGQFVESFRLETTPTPVASTDFVDAEANAVRVASFAGAHEQLTVDCQMIVRTTAANPFDFPLTRDNQTLPVTYTPYERSCLWRFLRRYPSSTDADMIVRYAQALVSECGGATIRFLTTLNRRLFEEHEVFHRPTGMPWPPEKTLAAEQGACRDLAWLMIDICRSVGLAARFVSGYQEPEGQEQQPELHAWAEVYLPHAGWRGHDPTHGLAVADRHVAVAAAAEPHAVTPITGTIRMPLESPVTSQMTSQLNVVVNDPACASETPRSLVSPPGRSA